jgi:Flp pilus assembly protein TadG
MLVLGIVDFGRAYFVRNALVSAVREGARLAAVQPADPCSAKATIRARVIQSFAPVGGAAISNTDAMIPITCTSENGRVATITVRVVGYQFTPITGIFRIVGLPSTLSLSATASFRWELAS